MRNASHRLCVGTLGFLVDDAVWGNFLEHGALLKKVHCQGPALRDSFPICSLFLAMFGDVIDVECPSVQVLLLLVNEKAPLTYGQGRIQPGWKRHREQVESRRHLITVEGGRRCDHRNFSGKPQPHGDTETKRNRLI